MIEYTFEQYKSSILMMIVFNIMQINIFSFCMGTKYDSFMFIILLYTLFSVIFMILLDLMDSIFKHIDKTRGY